MSNTQRDFWFEYSGSHFRVAVPIKETQQQRDYTTTAIAQQHLTFDLVITLFLLNWQLCTLKQKNIGLSGPCAFCLLHTNCQSIVQMAHSTCVVFVITPHSKPPNVQINCLVLTSCRAGLSNQGGTFQLHSCILSLGCSFRI